MTTELTGDTPDTSAADWKPNPWIACAQGFFIPYIAMFYVSRRYLALPYFITAIVTPILSLRYDNPFILFGFATFGALHAAWLANKIKTSTTAQYNNFWGLTILVLGLWLPLTATRTFFIDVYSIPSGSMLPNLKVNDLAVVSKTDFLSNLFISADYEGSTLSEAQKPIRGDIVTFKYPNDPEILFIKRVIAIPGDTVTIENKKVSINGQILPLQKINEEVKTTTWLEQNGNISYQIKVFNSLPRSQAEGTWIVPENAYFVMGDNRDNANDSRFWGFVPEHYLMGKLIAVY